MGEHQGSGSASRLDRIKGWAAFALAVFALHSIPFFQYPPGDLAYYVQPWYRHIIAAGRVQVFAEPFGNYTPPYLYLLSLTTLLYGVMALVYQIKLLALLGALWIVYASCRLCDALNAPRWGAFGILLLPSIVFNTSLLGQADTFWVAPCVLSLAASIREKWFWVAFWSGLAFAFKAQAVFFAPFVVYLFLKNRVPLWHWLVPIGVYIASMLPAWLDAPDDVTAEGFWATLDWWLEHTEDVVRRDPVPNRIAVIGRYDAGMGVRRPIDRFMRSEDPYGTLEFVEFGVRNGEVRDDVDPEMLASMLDWVAERFQDALVSADLDPGLIHRRPERREMRIKEFVEIMRHGIERDPDGD